MSNRLRTLNIGALNRQARAAQRGEPFVPGCTGKAAYSTSALAIEVRDRRRAAGQKRLSTYRCKHCKLWHLTSHPKRGGSASRAGNE
jgi:hypothetical protein